MVSPSRALLLVIRSAKYSTEYWKVLIDQLLPWDSREVPTIRKNRDEHVKLGETGRILRVLRPEGVFIILLNYLCRFFVVGCTEYGVLIVSME